MDESRTATPATPATVRPRHWKLTVEQYEKMGEVGILAYDRDLKLPLYARAGIPEVWLINREAQRVEVYRDPQGDAYRSVATAERGAAVTPLAFPDLHIQVNDILG